MRYPILTRVALLVALAIVAHLTGCGGGPSVEAPDAGSDPADAGAPVDAVPHDPDGAVVDAGSDPEPAPITAHHAGGYPSIVELAGTTALVGVGPRLWVWDLADPTAPALRGTSPPLPGLIGGIAVVGDRALVTTWSPDDGHLHVLRLGAGDPALVSTQRLGSGATARPTTVLVEGARALVADPQQGLFELDLARPDQPTLLAHHPDIRSPALIRVGRKLYGRSPILGGLRFEAFDLDANLAPLGFIMLPGAIGATVTDGDLLVRIGAAGVEVFDVSDPTAPALRSSAATTGARDVIAAGSTAYVTAADGLHVFDLAASRHDGPLARPPRVHAASAAAGTRLVRATDRGQLVVEDRADPRAPVPAAVVDTSDCARCVGAAGSGRGVTLIDSGRAASATVASARLSDLVASARARVAAPATLTAVEVAGDVAYVADRVAGVRVVDVADAPFETGTVLPGAASAVRATADRLYVAIDPGQVDVYDRADPRAPALVTSILAPGVTAIAIVEPYLLVADAGLGTPGGLWIYDTRGPGGALAHYDGCAHPRSVAAAGTTAILACTDNSYHILDLSQPWAPALQATFAGELAGSLRPIAIDGTRAYLGHAGGVLYLDISDPARPRVAAARATAAEVWTLDLGAPGRIIAAAGVAGVYQWAR